MTTSRASKKEEQLTTRVYTLKETLSLSMMARSVKARRLLRLNTN